VKAVVVAACTVLIVDDDLSILAAVSTLLEMEGYHVATARNGLEALERVQQEPLPHLVLLDMRMPLMDGWGFAREVRARGVPVNILVMTAARDAQAWAAEIGADGVIPKPFDLDQLLSEVERFNSPVS
jgi:CheY-like chemotaxis protein